MYEALKKHQFDDWCSSVKHFARKLSSKGFPMFDQDKSWLNKVKMDNISDYMIAQSLLGDMFYSWGISEDHLDEWKLFRVILEAFNDDEKIILDYTDLVQGGYCSEIQDDNDFIFEKVLILTEGISDSEFISQAIELLDLFNNRLSNPIIVYNTTNQFHP